MIASNTQAFMWNTNRGNTEMPKDNVVMRYADSYRSMARTGTATIDVWSIIIDLERNMAPEVTELLKEVTDLKEYVARLEKCV